jgi:hypothetical protein
MKARQKTAAKIAFARGASAAGTSSHRGTLQVRSERLKDILVIANKAGLFKGTRTKVVRGRMPEALVNKAKARTGIKSDTDLLEVALANLAVADEFPEWLLSQKGTINKDLDLEF